MGILDRLGNPKISNPMDAYRSGVQIGEQQRTKELSGQILAETLGSKVGMQAYKDLQRLNPDVAVRLKSALRTESDEEAQAFVGITKVGVNMLQEQGTSPEDLAKWMSGQMMLAEKDGRSGLAQRLSDAVQSLNNPETQAQTIKNMNATAAALGIGKQGTSEREFNSLISGLSKDDKERAKRIKLGLEGRASNNALLTAMAGGPEKLKLYMEALRDSSEFSEKGKLSAQLILKPQI